MAAGPAARRWRTPRRRRAKLEPSPRCARRREFGCGTLMDSRASICWRARPRRRRTFILLRPLLGLPSQRRRRRLKSATRGSQGRCWQALVDARDRAQEAACLPLASALAGYGGADALVGRRIAARDSRTVVALASGRGFGRSWVCLGGLASRRASRGARRSGRGGARGGAINRAGD